MVVVVTVVVVMVVVVTVVVVTVVPRPAHICTHARRGPFTPKNKTCMAVIKPCGHVAMWSCGHVVMHSIATVAAAV